MCCFDLLVLPFLFRVLIMKLLKSSIEYALQNSVSNHSRLFWWKCLISTALLWFSLAAYTVEALILKLFETFGRLHLPLWCWSFSLWFSLMYSSNNALLRFSRAFFFVQSQSWKSSTLRGICPAKLSFKLITTLPMEVSYRQSAALLFAGLLYCSSLNVETLREFRMTTLANVMLTFFSVVLNDVSYKQCSAMLCSCFLFCSSLSHENVQIFYRICSAKLSFNSFTFVPMEVSYKRSSLLLPISFKSQYWKFSRVLED